jgi:hypothetical protein
MVFIGKPRSETNVKKIKNKIKMLMLISFLISFDFFNSIFLISFFRPKKNQSHPKNRTQRNHVSFMERVVTPRRAGGAHTCGACNSGISPQRESRG